MHKSIFCFLLLIAFAGKSMAQSRDEKAVASAVEALRKLMVDPDTEKMEQITSDQLTYGHSGGNVQNRNEFIETLVSGRNDFVNIDLTEQSIIISGNTAIVRHKLTAATNDGGKPGNVKLYVMLVWQKIKGQWLLLARQAVKVTDHS